MHLGAHHTVDELEQEDNMHASSVVRHGTYEALTKTIINVTQKTQYLEEIVTRHEG